MRVEQLPHVQHQQAPAGASRREWSEQEAHAFHQAFLDHGANWHVVASNVGPTCRASDCALLFEQHRMFLSLPPHTQHPQAFAAMVLDHQRALVSVVPSPPSHQPPRAATHSPLSDHTHPGLTAHRARRTPRRTPRTAEKLRKATAELVARTTGGAIPIPVLVTDPMDTADALLSLAHVATTQVTTTHVTTTNVTSTHDTPPLYEGMSGSVVPTPDAAMAFPPRRGQHGSTSSDSPLPMVASPIVASPSSLTPRGHPGATKVPAVVQQSPSTPASTHGHASDHSHGMDGSNGGGSMLLQEGTTQRTPSSGGGDSWMPTIPPSHPAHASRIPPSSNTTPARHPLHRCRTRKPLPEKLPPRLTPATSLFIRRASYLNMSASTVLSMGLTPAQVLSSPQLMQPPPTHEEAPPARMLRHALSTRVRRWCLYEFVTSAIDRPWFMQQPNMQALLDALHLPSLTHMRRTDWQTLRRALGRPRRLSLAFLKQQRARLTAWRNQCREAYRALAGGGPVGGLSQLPAGVPPQLAVGQRVSARHPATRQLHEGGVLTVEGDSYRVQFDRTELSVETVSDVDLMPVNPLKNLPESATTPTASVGGMGGMGGMVMNGHMHDGERYWGRDWGPAHKRVCPDVRARVVEGLLDGLTAVERKATAVSQLRTLNDQVSSGVVNPHHVDASGFKQTYARSVLAAQQADRALVTSMTHLDNTLKTLHSGSAGLFHRARLAAHEHVTTALSTRTHTDPRPPLPPEIQHLMETCMSVVVALQALSSTHERVGVEDVAVVLEGLMGQLQPRGRLGVVKLQEVRQSVVQLQRCMGGGGGGGGATAAVG